MIQWGFLHISLIYNSVASFLIQVSFPIDSYHLEGVDVKPNSTVEHVSFSDGQINLRLNSGDEVSN